MSCIIVSGGTVSDRQILDFREKLYKKTGEKAIEIAADSGLSFFIRNHILPDMVIGDFDSADEQTKAAAMKMPVPVTFLKPQKDDTDTEAALSLAFLHSKGEIYIFGGIGTRMDHVLGNIAILGQGLAKKRSVYLMDEHNRIRLLDTSIQLKKEEQFGTYISLIPLSDQVDGVTLRGFKYPLQDAILSGYTSLGVSNEIVNNEAEIRLKSGVLIMIESLD